MKAPILALQLMTRLPLPDVKATSADMARAIRWFPLAGMVVGACLTGAVWAGGLHSAALAALCGLLVWVGITGALHLDGLGDIADASGAAHVDRARLSAVLADPHIGSFGVVAIVLQLLAKLVLLFLACSKVPWLGLVLVPVAARIAPLLWTLMLPPLHAGMGTRFGSGANWQVCLAWSALLAVCAWAFAPALLAVFPANVLWALWLKRRIGGISGDGHGAGIEIAETATLAALVVLA
ncbi:adenosylcobinamide-GDP ribazoletransferase [Novosphingobium sp. BW1]|uniref:adenosylcobinamide-GDP ribazoletransferase n=1 Tax=Novosphingobium sp. BW1 TaxID=2592621 RepID=UPI0011DE6BF0|nr:adenosylcobinamide-GDP ribazoletransferase [Novosphingobium sp. BW1]TYC87009.1 adenosylcobinamide-GDP ribazoletransferase [Novosphingobium sp. BW1]